MSSSKQRYQARAKAKAKAAAVQEKQDKERSASREKLVASASQRRFSQNGRQPKLRSTSKLRQPSFKQIHNIVSPDVQLETMQQKLKMIQVTEALANEKKKTNWNNSWVGKLGFSYGMKKNTQLALWTIGVTFILGCALVMAKEFVMHLKQPTTVNNQTVMEKTTDKMTCSDTCRELINSALCHSKCISVDRLAENIKGLRSCSMDIDIVDSSLDDKEQWDKRKRQCFAALDLGTLVCPRDVSVGEEGVISEGGSNIARDLFECLRPSAFASFTSQCVGLLKAMKC